MIEKPYTDISISSLEGWSESKDHALIMYYTFELAAAHAERAVYVDKVKETETKIDNLNTEFAHLRAKYPEEFI